MGVLTFELPNRIFQMSNGKSSSDYTVPLVVAGAFAVGMMLYAKNRAIDILNYYIQGLQFTWIGTAPAIIVIIGIQNPSNENFEIKSIVGNIYQDGNLIGNVSAFQTVTLRNNSQILYPITIRISLIGIVVDLVNLLQNGNGNSRSITFVGSINASGFVVPIELNYKVV